MSLSRTSTVDLKAGLNTTHLNFITLFLHYWRFSFALL